MGEPFVRHPRGLAAQPQAAYARNPLFQPDPVEVLRAKLGTGSGEAPGRDEGFPVRDDVEAGTALWERRHEDALAPLLTSIRSNQGDPIHSAFSEQMNKLYQVFKNLYDQDQVEIRRLLTTLETQKQQLQRLAAEKANVRQQMQREREQGAAALAATSTAAAAAAAAGGAHTGTAPPGAAAPALAPASASKQDSPSKDGQAGHQRSQQPHMHHQRSAGGSSSSDSGGGALSAPHQQRSSRQRSGVDRMGRGAATGAAEGGGGGDGLMGGRYSTSTSRRDQQQSRIIIFLPYMLHPAHHCWRFYAAWQSSWTTRRTAWLAAAWLLVFLLAVGLLVGLLVPWGNLTSTKFEGGSPAVAAVGPGQVSLMVQLNRAATVYYAVVPEAVTSGGTSGRRLLALGSGALVHAAAGSSPLPGNSEGGGSSSSRPCWLPWPASWLLRPWWSCRQGQGQQLHGPQSQQPAQSWWQPQYHQHRGQKRRRYLSSSSSVLKLSDVEADDVREIAEEEAEEGVLFPFAVACGVVSVSPKYTNYTLTVSGIPLQVATAASANVTAQQQGNGTGIATAPQECLSSFGLALNGSTTISTSSSGLPVSSGPFRARRCQRCPVLLPDTSYVVLLMGDGGRRTKVIQVRVQTASVPAATTEG